MRERESGGGPQTRSSSSGNKDLNNSHGDAASKAAKGESSSSSSDALKICLVVGFALVLRWCVSCHPYSGSGKPPMYGDYEAQRHWQEITVNLPHTQWYSNSSDNDLQYWGLDYPPLTAYHSYVLGRLAKLVDPDSVKLHQSRGYESAAHKYFMRLSVLVADLFVFVPAVIYFVNVVLPLFDAKSKKQQQQHQERGDGRKGESSFIFKKRHFALATILLYPGLILIDYGHFQYNCVSLGFFVAAASALFQNSPVIGSILFVLALSYKQMELYHALPCFFYVFGVNYPGKRKTSLPCLRTLICTSMAVILTFFATWAPFLRDRKVFIDLILRLFPLARGIFEDKVANVWCAINVVYKLRNYFTNYQLAQICLVATTVSLLPSSLDLFFRPSREKLLLAFVNSSLSFFLFSFQVHEKSILLVAVPVLLQFHKDPFYCFWFLVISVFSMLPLLIKDGLFSAYLASLVFFVVLVSWMWFEPGINGLLKPKEEKPEETTSKQAPKKVRFKKSVNACTTGAIYMNILLALSLLGVLILSICSVFVKPPKRYPDLYPLLISVYSCGHFVLFLIYFNYKQFRAVTVPARKFKVK